MPRVDRLHDGLVVGGKLRKVHNLRAVHQFPPVQVLPVIGGEVTKHRMGVLDVGASGMWRAHLKPRRVPKDGQEGVAHVVAIADFPIGTEQHGAALLQYLQSPGVEGVGFIEVGGWKEKVPFILRIDPKTPMILDILGELYRQRQFGRTLHEIQRQRYDTQRNILTNG